MLRFPEKLKKKIEIRKNQDSFRSLKPPSGLVDFSSNDYLGFSASIRIFEGADSILRGKTLLKNGSTGSRLLTGNHDLYAAVEEELCNFHRAPAALIFNSGYDANLGFFAAVPQRDDLVLYDEYSHASIRDGIALGKANALKFRHNDLQHLESLISRYRKKSFSGEIYIVTEAVFSMDGDMPHLLQLASLAQRDNCLLIVDEAHSVYVHNEEGESLVEKLELEDVVFARLITFGKALGAHGAAILGSEMLKDYLVNFSRSFIYTTALSPHSLATILSALQFLKSSGGKSIEKLHQNIGFFNSEVHRMGLSGYFLESTSAIRSCVVPGNEQVRNVSDALQKKEFDVKPILSPTVPAGKERLRFCLHSFNTSEEIETVLLLLQENLQKSENE